jgi:hypothetical protein
MTERQYLIQEHAVEGRRLGRSVLHDERSKDFPAEQAGTVKAVDHESHGLPLDQDGAGSCTAEATCAALNTAPDAAKEKGRTFTQTDAFRLYALETQLEGQPWIQGDPSSPDPGGTGLMVCKAAKQLGWIRSYRHAFGLEHAVKALVLRPNIWGVNWYSSMDDPDPATGIITISPGAFIRGGHEICATRIVPRGSTIPGTEETAPDDLAGFWQSWGRWGLNGTGRFFMSFGDLDRLLSEDGDVTVPLP